jgi:hypothetical protein
VLVFDLKSGKLIHTITGIEISAVACAVFPRNFGAFVRLNIN